MTTYYTRAKKLNAFKPSFFHLNQDINFENWRCLETKLIKLLAEKKNIKNLDGEAWGYSKLLTNISTGN